MHLSFDQLNNISKGYQISWLNNNRYGRRNTGVISISRVVATYREVGAAVSISSRSRSRSKRSKTETTETAATAQAQVAK